MAQRLGEALDVGRCGEGYDGDLTPRCLNLVGVNPELGQVLLTEQAAKVAQQDQYSRSAEQSPGLEVIPADIAQREIELDSRHSASG